MTYKMTHKQYRKLRAALREIYSALEVLDGFHPVLSDSDKALKHVVKAHDHLRTIEDTLEAV